jgi:TatD DNase family protein
MFVDTHAHLQWGRFDRDREKVINRARNANVKRIVNVGFDVMGSIKGIELAEKNKGLYATVGIHPHNASSLNEAVLDNLRKLSKNPKVVAIGEIGLDYYRTLSPKEAQKNAFEAQLFLAEELKLPVIVHNREADDDTLEILSKFSGRIKGILHCFSGDLKMAEQCVKHNHYLSVAGPVTFPNSHNLQKIVRWVDLSYLLLETDSPWLAPQSMRGKRNEPAFLVYVAKKIAKLKGISMTELAEATTENSKKILALS